ncbi:MAG: fumarylacetoacetate hydrolase family protein [Anaerolineae bacterium]
MIPEFSLCRFRAAGSAPRLGLVAGGRLYDLTATGQDAYASFEAWLKSAAGRVPQALDALRAVPNSVVPLGAAEDLLGADGSLKVLSPLDTQEVWACGVTYEMSLQARMRESEQPTVYGMVYEAPRPEIFFKATPQRVVGPEEAVGIRADSSWDVPEAEMALVVTPKKEIVGYTMGNDMSSRDIEGQNPLYLPQAKVYDRCCALGPYVRLEQAGFDPLKQEVTCTIYRDGASAWSAQTSTSRIHRPLAELVRYLGRCNSFPNGTFVLTGTGVVPPDTFTLAEGDVVEITFDGLGTLRNPVIELPVD